MESIHQSRRTVLKMAVSSSITSAGLIAASGTASAANSVDVRIIRDEYTSGTLVDNVRDSFNNSASSEFSVTVEAEYWSRAEVDTVFNYLYDAIGSDAYDASATRGIRQYIEDTSTHTWEEGRCYLWLTDYDEWPGDNGNALGSAYADSIFDHDCTNSAPHWAAGSVDSKRNSTSDVVGTFMHEYGHLSMHTDHKHHQIYDYEKSSGDVVSTTCMTGPTDDSCTAGTEGSYSNTDFGPTMADCVEDLVEYQSPAYEHDSSCQLDGSCDDQWQVQDDDGGKDDTFGPASPPVDPKYILDNFPGEPPVIE